MGLFWQGIPSSFLPKISNALGTSFMAVESGTYKGRTAQKLARIAEHVTTIEADFNYFLKSKRALQQHTNITIIHGNSGVLIGNTLPSENIGCVMWLDAHYSGGNTAGSQYPCPIMDELLQILPLRQAANSVIFIDDSRSLNGANGWPILSEVVDYLNQHDYFSIIIDDVLIASSKRSLDLFTESVPQCRTYTLESLGGRMSVVLPFVRILGFVTSLGFRIKSKKKFHE